GAALVAVLKPRALHHLQLGALLLVQTVTQFADRLLDELLPHELLALKTLHDVARRLRRRRVRAHARVGDDINAFLAVTGSHALGHKAVLYDGYIPGVGRRIDRIGAFATNVRTGSRKDQHSDYKVLHGVNSLSTVGAEHQLISIARR